MTENKVIVQRFYSEVVANGQHEHIEKFVGLDYIDHNSISTTARGPSVMRDHLIAVRQTFPDFTLSIEDMMGEGDRVVTRVIGHGTHRGEWQGIRPTGKVIQLRGINIDRIAGGKIVEHWGDADTIGMLIQMGVDPFGRGSRA